MLRWRRRTVVVAAAVLAGVLVVVVLVTVWPGGGSSATSEVDGNQSAVLYSAGHRPAGSKVQPTKGLAEMISTLMSLPFGAV